MLVLHKSIYDPAEPVKDGHRLLVTRFWPLTLLCTCRDELCHRVVLADILKRKLGQKRTAKR